MEEIKDTRYPAEIEGINDTQIKILNLCYAEAKPMSFLVQKLNMNRGYLYDLCLRLRGKGLLQKLPSKRRNFFATNKDRVKL